MYILDSVANARELGGYRLPDGRSVRPGLLLRGGALNCASDEDISILSDRYRLAHVIDFRTEGEVLRAPDREVPGADNIWLPAIDPETEKTAGQSLPKEAYLDLDNWLVYNASNPLVQDVARRLYTDMVMNEYTQLQYAAFLEKIVSTTEGAVYWHCSQGKDRTGLGAAFILAALGADRELIMEDYCRSADYYEEELATAIARLRAAGGDAEAEKVMRTFISVNPEYFTAALDLIDRRFGSMEAYLRGPLCLTDFEFGILRSRYLE